MYICNFMIEGGKAHHKPHPNDVYLILKPYIQLDELHLLNLLPLELNKVISM